MESSKHSQQAIRLLKEGNARFVADRMEHPRRDAQTRAQLTAGQTPFAAILTCADSRVSPELVFDQGLGDLFVIRNAGNVAGTTAIASVEYAVAQLGVGVVLVMGHEQCGAVQAAIDEVELGHIASVLAKISPAVQQAKSLPGNVLDNAIRINTEHMAEQLRRTDPVIKPACESGQIKILSAVYKLSSGKVMFGEFDS